MKILIPSPISMFNLSRLYRLVGAEGLGGKVVAGYGVGPGSAAAADPAVLANPAFAVVVVEVAHLEEECRGVPYLRERFLLDVARLFFEKPADLHLAHMRYEREALAAHASLGHGVEPVRFRSDRLALLFLALAEDAVVVRGAGWLELDRDLVPHFIKPLERALIFLGRDLLVRQLLAPARRHQEEWMVRDGAQADDHLQKLRQVLHVMLRDGRVHLEFHSDF